jgi:gliding motility-associated-like protein
MVHENGTYQLIVNYRSCADTDETNISYHPAVKIDLGNDTDICKGLIINLPQTVTTSVADRYLWQDGSAEKTFKVSEPGKYFVTLYNICETITDSIVITKRNCHFFFPSIFTPNGDGRNDMAHLVGDINALTDFNLAIYNRWGQCVYATNNPADGWNGDYKGKTAELGTYYYLVRYKYLGEAETLKGDIVLMR